MSCVTHSIAKLKSYNNILLFVWMLSRTPTFSLSCTGLDPARPGFDFDDPAARLDSSDAMFVDVIHTDVRNGPIDSSLGLQRSCGHVDFYPNGGKQQPGCGTSHVIEGAWSFLLYLTFFYSLCLNFVHLYIPFNKNYPCSS